MVTGVQTVLSDLVWVDSGEQETCMDVRFERAVHVLAEKLGIRQRAGLGGTESESNR